MSLDFDLLEKEIGKLCADPNYSHHYASLEKNHDKLKELREEFSHTSDSSQILRIEETFHHIKKSISDITQQLHQIEFVNRTSEISYITHVYYPPYLLVSAPTGYGKTRLLTTVKSHLTKQNYLCIHVEVVKECLSIEGLVHSILQQLKIESIEELDLTTPKRAGSQISKALLKSSNGLGKNVALIIDRAELLNEDTAKELFDFCIPAINAGLSIAGSPIRFRLIMAGRYIANWKILSSRMSSERITLQPISLTPFDFPAVYRTVENFAANSDMNVSHTYNRDFAAHLMAFTGGHPGCMAAILSKDFGLPIQLISSNRKEYETTIINPIISEITGHFPDELKEILTTLSVVRRFTPRFLRRLKEKDLIQWTGSEFELESELLKTRFVTIEQGFLQDGIARRLLSIQLRRNKPERFRIICNEAILFYKETLKSFRSHRVDIIAIELLFQQLLHFDLTAPKIDKKVIKILLEVPKELVQGYEPRSIMANFIEDLQKDWEFRFMLNYVCRQDTYNDDEPYNELIKELYNFYSNIQDKV